MLLHAFLRKQAALDELNKFKFHRYHAESQEASISVVHNTEL